MRGVNNKCASVENKECWIDVTALITTKCSGHRTCQVHVLYSVDLPHDEFAEKCLISAASKPSLFVEFSCVSKALFTELSGSSHVDPEQVGGYLTSVDYTDALTGGTEWRSQLADAVCQPKAERLPFRFNLSAPIIQGSRGYGHEESVSFVLRIRDFGLTQPSFGAGSNGPPERRLRLAGDFHCPGPGSPCQQDYLEIMAKLSTDGLPNHKGTRLLLPVARFCLVSESSDAHSSQTESALIGRKFGPLPASTELQFTSNLNLLDPLAVPGKGILIEYIALFCSPINPPSGFGVVDYRFQFLAHPSHTIAYAEIFCPSDRWLEPIQPKEGHLADDPWWWLTRQRNATLICDHHSRTWSPDRIPEACLTESELEAFVTKLRAEQEHRVSPDVEHKAPPNPPPEPAQPVDSVVQPLDDQDRTAEESLALHVDAKPIAEEGSNVALSIAIGVVFAIIICLLAILLLVYCSRYRLALKYQKPVNCPSVQDHRMTRSASSFDPSVPSIYPSTVYSMDWRRKWGSRSKWELFRPWRQRQWSQNLSGTYPDLPRQTLLRGSGNGTPETVILDRPSAKWRYPMQRSNASSYSLGAGYQGTPRPDTSAGASPSPWLRTNSTTRLGFRQQFFASSTELVSPVDGSPLIPHSWWLPWRRSIRRQRRIQNHLQRRRDAHYLSQRRLLDSGGMSNSSSFHMGLSPSTTLGLTGSTQLKVLANGYPVAQTPQVSSPVRRYSERPLSQETTHSCRTLATMCDNGRATETDKPFDVSPTSQCLFPYSNVDPATGYPIELQLPIPRNPVGGNTLVSGTNEPLPSKITPPGNSISEGLKRLSSFLRSLNDSLTPPRSGRHWQKVHSNIQPRAMSSTLHTRTHAKNGLHDLVAPLSPLSEFHSVKTPRCKSDSGSLRIHGRELLQSIFHLNGCKDDQTPSVYNLIADDASTVGDANSSSMATRTSCIDSIGPTSTGFPYAGPQYWTNYPPLDNRLSETGTLRAQSTNTCVTSVQTGHNVNPADLYEMNNPYLIPTSVKRQRREKARCNAPNGVLVRNSGSDHIPSGTSSAISSLIFADSVDEEPDGVSPVDIRHAQVAGACNGHPAEPTNHLTAIDYFTYDQAHTLAGPMTTDQAAKVGGGELFTTQISAHPGHQDQLAQVPLRTKEGANDGTKPSRPLSDAMISNHYYDGNDMHLDYSDYPHPSPKPPRLPPRSPPPATASGSFKLHPALPPIWPLPKPKSGNSCLLPPGTAFQVAANNHLTLYEPSSDSLYETVDNLKPRLDVEHPKPPVPSRTGVSEQESGLLRQKIALPPTPGSAESMKAPVASIDEDTDGGLSADDT